MIVKNLPLLDLFSRLREAGLPLGINEYRLLLRALQAGFGLPDRTALAQLCKTLWIKSSEEAELFDHHFERIISKPIVGSSVVLSTEIFKKATEKLSQLFKNLEQWILKFISPNKKSAIKEKTETADLRKTSKETLPSTAELALGLQDEIQAAQAILHRAGGQDAEIALSKFIQSSEYFPVTRRQMKQSWRYFRRPVREGPPAELDLAATIHKIARHGMLLEPVLVPRRINRAEVLLLIDQEGSMTPFHALGRRLVETASRGGRLRSAEVYYFHNCPHDFLHLDPARSKAISISEFGMRFQNKSISVLIFSDAGAARGGFNPERLELTEKFIANLKQKVRSVAWLNPMPRSRWFGTTAAEIASLAPMFEIDRRGLDHTISVLRGRTSHFV